MRILILSCNTGQGHNSAAKAIKEYFENNSCQCEIKDALAFWSEQNSRLICKGHIFVYRNMPRLFGVGYGIEERRSATREENSILYELAIKGCGGLLKYINSNTFDAVICTHIFSAMMMTELKKKGESVLPAYFVATDYTCYPGVSENMLNGYFIPHSALCEEFVQNGIEQKYLIPSGIPISSAFYTKLPRDEARQKLKLPKEKRIVLLMCGSMGCGPIREMYEVLSGLMTDNCHLVIICGNNRKLYNSLASERKSNVTVVGYTTRVPLYMDAADLLLTKPGGLSTTEAAVKGLPMFFIDAVPGCETKNLNFFTALGFAHTENSIEALAATVCYYLHTPQRLDAMSALLRENFTGCAAKKIYEHILKEVACGGSSELSGLTVK